MKILWFTNTPSLGKSKTNDVVFGGGWMEALQAKLQKIPEVELGLSFYSTSIKEAFTFNETRYFPLQRKSEKRIDKLFKIIRRKKPNYEEEISKYLSVIEIFKPDIIHIFGTEYPYGLIANKTKVPVLIWIQGNLTIYNIKWFSGFSFNEIRNITSLKKRVKRQGILDYYYQMEDEAQREQEVFRRCKFFLGRTDWDRRITSIFSPESKYFHCDEMLREQFYKNEFVAPNPNKEFRIVSVLNPNIYKGFETIFETMLLLSKHSHNIKWEIIGVNKDDDIIKLAKRKSRKEPEELNIFCLGKLDSEALVSKLLQSNLFIHPSHIENSPNSICEAMVMGLPVICTFAGGTSSLLENKKEGVIVQDGDPYSLAGAIIECIGNYDLFLNYGRNARERALIRHNPDTIISRLIAIYEEIKSLNKV